MTEIEDAEFAIRCVKGELQFAVFQNVAILVTENWDKNLPPQLVFDWLPINIKKISKLRCRTVFQHIKPPRIVASHHPHVVCHDVKNLSHAMSMQLGDESFVFFRTANFRVQTIVVDNVIAVGTSRSGPEIWRR